MHLHILGICGTFMAGVAALAREAGHRVTGCDQNVYPPMSDQLAALDIELISGWDPEQIALAPDVFVVGNVVSRGNPLMEAILDAGLPYTSGPEWLARVVLPGRRVIAVAGTHGKTTTASLVAWLLQATGRAPGFLIGGVPANFGVSARLGDSAAFVVEADEYDTAFFDKRAKFVHYRPEVAVLNNLEFDHADIYSNLAAIEWQFHQLLRMVPGQGQVIVPVADDHVARVLAQGCWTPCRTFGPVGSGADLQARLGTGTLDVIAGDRALSTASDLIGQHNAANLGAALSAAEAVGVPLADAVAAVPGFRSVARRLQRIYAGRGIEVLDDFAHHPTAIRLTLDALATRASDRRIVAVCELRSNTMRSGVHASTLGPALERADAVFVLHAEGLDWAPDAALAALPNVSVATNADVLGRQLLGQIRPGDDVVLMSNGDFGGLREMLVAELTAAEQSQ